MKRPSGFDREPEQAEPARGPERARESRSAQWSAATERSAPAERPDPARVPEPVVPLAQTEPLLSDSPLSSDTPAASGKSGGEAERDQAAAATVDLSEVRQSPRALTRAVRELDPVREAEKQMRAATRQLKRRERQESRRFSAASRQRRTWWIIAGSAVLALAAFVAVGVFTPVMSVRHIEITGATSVNSAEVEQALARLSGTPLALVDEGEVRAALEPFALIQRYALERIPPDTLLVRIEERVPVVSIEQDGAFLQYDAAGVLVGSAEAAPAGVPVADGRVRELDSEAFLSAAQVLRDMPAELRAQVVGVSASSGQDVLFALGSGAEVMWGGPDDTARKAAVLTAMFTSLVDVPVSYFDVSSSEAPVFR